MWRHVATRVVQTRATSPVGGQSVGGRRVGVAFFVCRSAKRCGRRPLWSFGLASSSSSLGLAVLWHPVGQCAARLCKGWWACCSVATPRVSMLRRTLQALSAAGGQSSQHRPRPGAQLHLARHAKRTQRTTKFGKCRVCTGERAGRARAAVHSAATHVCRRGAMYCGAVPMPH